MRSSVIRAVGRGAALTLLCASLASAQEPSATPGARAGETNADAVTLGRYLEALSSERLLAAETGSRESLRALIVVGEELYFEQRYDEAALALYEVVESPRFADFSDNPEFAGAELLIAGALAELGALRSAAGYLLRTLQRGQEEAYFGPAYRRFVDIALQSGDLERAIAELEALGVEDLPEDAQNELRYLRGRRAYDGGVLEEAETHLAAITARSRFYANAQYLRGVVAARRGELDEAEARFCSIATTGDQERTTFYVDSRYYRIKDLAWLGLGRVAHEGLRSDDAFYYYFQIPNDSERVAEALFEAAYAMYEGDDYDTAIDLLDQLEARFPASPFVDEAALLRGYVHLGRCEFEEASQQFVAFQAQFGPLVDELDAILENETRQERIVEDLLREESVQRQREAEALDPEAAAERARESLRTVDGRLLALLRVDPTFYELHSQIRLLDAESARAGRLASDLRGLEARLGAERPAAAAAEIAFTTERDEVRAEIATARQLLDGLTRQLDAVRRGGGDASEIRALETSLAGHAQTLRGLVRQLRQAELGETDEPTGDVQGVRALLRSDARTARQLPARVRDLRVRLVDAGGVVAVRGVRQLRERLGGALRRARIGRIDAVMGSKRRIEIQIESLAAGRFPPELIDPLRIQGLLRDDEEYWPFEGELWTDEFEQPEAEPEEDE